MCPHLFIGQASSVSKKTQTALFFVPLVPGFSTASYLKVHIKTHHGAPLPTIHTFPEPRGELQMHNGNPFHMGRQCLVEGKRPLVPFQTFMFLAFHLFCCFLEGKKTAHTAASVFEMEPISRLHIRVVTYAGCPPAACSRCPLTRIDNICKIWL